MPDVPYEVGDSVIYDAGEGTDTWEVTAVYESCIELRNAMGETTFYFFEEA